MDRSFAAARAMMDKAGFKILDPVKVSVDPQLPFMGYTMPEGGSFSIVVSGGSVGSGMLEGLLVHEMSHIYRMQTKHPSHNPAILDEAVENILGENRLLDYQQKILHDLLNDIQDLYADDIAFRVFRGSRAPFLKDAADFLQSWVKDEPVRSGDTVRDRWANASILVHNARAVAQMQRHNVEDVGGKAAEGNQRFLDRSPRKFMEGFTFFRNTLAGLKENMTGNEYRTLLAAHLEHFMELVDQNNG